MVGMLLTSDLCELDPPQLLLGLRERGGRGERRHMALVAQQTDVLLVPQAKTTAPFTGSPSKTRSPLGNRQPGHEVYNVFLKVP